MQGPKLKLSKSAGTKHTFKPKKNYIRRLNSTSSYGNGQNFVRILKAKYDDIYVFGLV